MRNVQADRGTPLSAEPGSEPSAEPPPLSDTAEDGDPAGVGNAVEEGKASEEGGAAGDGEASEERKASAPGDPPAPVPPAARPVRRGRSRIVLAVVAVLALAADLFTKLVVVDKLENTDHPPVEFIPNVLYFVHTRNTGAAFSLGSGYTVVLTVIAVGVVLFILRTARKLGSLGWAVALGLVLGGAIGNLLDRLFRARGGVVDFLAFVDPYDPPWPVFNLADSSLVVGVAILVVLELTGRRIEGGRVQDSKDD